MPSLPQYDNASKSKCQELAEQVETKIKESLKQQATAIEIPVPGVN